MNKGETLPEGGESEAVLVHAAGGSPRREAMRYVTKGEHAIRVVGPGEFSLESLTVKSIPELIPCGLGFNPEIKSYGLYDLDFLKADVLPNVTTLIVPNNLNHQEIIGTNFIRTIVDGNHRVALERCLHEMSSEQGSKDALQLFVDGIADWEAREPGVTKRAVIHRGLLLQPGAEDPGLHHLLLESISSESRHGKVDRIGLGERAVARRSGGTGTDLQFPGNSAVSGIIRVAWPPRKASPG